MITLSDRYSNIVKSNDFNSDWIIQLYYDDETNFTGYSGNGQTVDSIFYRPTVNKFSNISEQIDLVKMNGQISNVVFELVNTFSNDTGFLTEELWGDRKYFNRKIKIYGMAGRNIRTIDNDISHTEWLTELSDLPLLFEGRFINGDHNENIVKVTAEHRQPWEGLSMCSASAADGTTIPFVYGLYQVASSSIANPQYITGSNVAKVWPMPVAQAEDNLIRTYTYDSIGASADAHYYERGLKEYIPIDGAVTTTSAFNSASATSCDKQLPKGFKILSDSISSNTNWNNTTNAIDGNIATRADVSESLSVENSGETDTEIAILNINLPSLDHTLTSLIRAYDWGLGASQDGGQVSTVDVELNDNTFGSSSNIGTDADSSGLGFNSSGNTVITDVGQEWPTDIRVEFTGSLSNAEDGVGDEAIVNSYISNTVITINSKAIGDQLQNVRKDNPFLYCGADGFPQSYVGGSSTTTCTDVYECIRDIIKRITGVDTADADFSINNDGAWPANLSTDRGNNFTKWWLNLTPMETVMQELQYFASMIWLYKSDKVKIIYPISSYSDNQIQFNLTQNELSNIKISMTKLKDIRSKQITHYDLDPATSLFLQERTLTNSNRGDWNFEDDENILTEENTYYDNVAQIINLHGIRNRIYGAPKLIISADITDWKSHNIEIGDMVKFSNMPYKPWNQTIESKPFMVIKVRKTPIKASVTFREIEET